jgi:hypothetical protein
MKKYYFMQCVKMGIFGKMVKSRKAPKAAYSVGIRPSPDLLEKLRKAAESSGRSINKEAEARIAASFGDTGEGLFAGWPVEDQDRFRALANIVGLLAARCALLYGDVTLPPLLRAIEAAMNEVFIGLGATREPAKNDSMFAMLGRQMVGDMQLAARMKNPTGEDGALAEAAKAWGISVEGAS